MKRNRLRPIGLLLSFLCGWACSSSGPYKKIHVEIPAPRLVSLDAYNKIIVTDFWVAKTIPDLDLNRELRTYWRAETERRFDKSAVLIETPFDAEPALDDPAFRLRLSSDAKGSLLLTGKAQLSQETRKALSDEALKELDGPFEPEKKLLERKVVTLEISLFLLGGETGDILFKKDFKETKSYENIRQPASFAFFELLQKVKQKFFRAVLGEARAQERFLITD